MERLIVNEGQGAVPRDLTAAVTRVGSAPGCDVLLRHASAAGCSFVIERTTHGHRARAESGALFHNEDPCVAADLLHNDTLRVGDTLVLYKNPDATLPAAGPPRVASFAAPPPLEDLSVLEALEPLEELSVLDELAPVEELEVLEELETLGGLEQIDELETLQELTAAASPVAAVSPPRAGVQPAPPAAEPMELEALDELEVVAELKELEALEAPATRVDVPESAEQGPLELLESVPELAARPPAGPLGVTLPDAVQPPEPEPKPAPAPVRAPAKEEKPATASAVREPLRSAEGIRFRRPLPHGRRGPTFLPPVHPGRPGR